MYLKFHLKAGACKEGFIYTESNCLGVTHKTYDDGMDNSVVSAACEELDSSATELPKSSVCHANGQDSRRAIEVTYSIKPKCTYTDVIL